MVIAHDDAIKSMAVASIRKGVQSLSPYARHTPSSALSTSSPASPSAYERCLPWWHTLMLCLSYKAVIAPNFTRRLNAAQHASEGSLLCGSAALTRTGSFPKRCGGSPNLKGGWRHD